MTDMTLEQLRDRLRDVEGNPRADGIIWPGEAGDMADAIDDHLAKAAQVEAVAEVRHFNYSGIARNGFSQEVVLLDSVPTMPEGTKLYAAPPTFAPTQPVEAVPAAWRYVTPVGEWMSRGLDEADFRIASEKGYEIQSRYEPAKPIEGVEDIRNAVEKAVTEHCNGSDLWLSTYLAAQCIATALAHPRPTGDAIAEVAIVGWAWLLVDERTGHDYDRGFSWGEAKPDIPARAGTHYDYRALIGRDKAIAASGDCNAFIHSNRGLLHDLGAHVVVDVVDVEQQASPLVQEVPVRGARLSRDEGLTAPTDEQAGEVAWTKKAAEFIEKKAQSYADEFGRDDMGSISFGAGRGADKMEEYWMSLIDLAEDFRKLGGKCQVPPDGWECSRAVGHDGPCAASPTASEDLPHGTKLYAQPRLTVPEGYRLVPVEPTEAMLVSGRNENLCCADDADRIYAAMIAAAPDGEVG